MQRDVIEVQESSKDRAIQVLVNQKSECAPVEVPTVGIEQLCGENA